MHHAHIDKFAYLDSPIHRLDPRVKLIAVVVFSFAVISLPSFCVSILACYAVGPFAVLVFAAIPLRFVLGHLIAVSPFIVVLAAAAPFYNTEPIAIHLGDRTFSTTLGWLQFLNILGKFIITMSGLIALVCTTRFADLLVAMEKLRLPRVLVSQLGFLYRYIFVLIDRIHHILRARSGRKLRNLGFKNELRTASAIIGALFVHSIETSHNIAIAMSARGFDGTFRSLGRMQIKPADYCFSVFVITFLILIQFVLKPVLI